jgi:hypothetical protein
MNVELRHTPLRHRMLFEAPFGETNLVLECKNVKRAIWRPRRVGAGFMRDCSASESRAITELFDHGLLNTPDWQGDTDVLRVLRITAAGLARLAAWDARHGSVGTVSS